MNVDNPELRLRDTKLLDAAFDAATRGIGLHGKALPKRPAAKDRWGDAGVRLALGAWKKDFVAEIKAGLRPGALGAIMHRLAPYKDRALLVADHVTPPMADTLRAEGIQFLDTAGNAYLEQPGVFVWVKGERPERPFHNPRDRGRAFAPTGLQVLLTLLCKPELADRPYREIAIVAGVAHGTVGWVMPELEPMGFITTLAGKRRLFNAGELLKRWTEAYLRALRPKLVLGRYHADNLAWWNTVKPRAYGYTLGGEAAAGRITNYLRPGTIAMYGDKIEPRFLIDHKLRNDRNGEVEILRRFWNFDPDAELAPLPVIYADLIRTGDARCIETAQQIEEKFLAGLESSR